MDYIIFILGYDLLHDWFNKFEDAPCDNVFEACTMIAREFNIYDIQNPAQCSTYEALQKWLEGHMEVVRFATHYYAIM